MRFSRKTLATSLLALILSMLAMAAHSGTLFSYKSDPGDYIGQGETQLLTPEDGTFFMYGFTGGVQITFHSDTWWNLTFVAPQGHELTVGKYDHAQRWPFQSPTKPGMDISGDWRGCNTLSGKFEVLQAVYNGAGVLVRFAADFEQHCEGATPALRGSIRYNATVGFPPIISIMANNSHDPITIAAGESVNLQIAVDAGNKRNIPMEKWLAIAGPTSNHWYSVARPPRLLARWVEGTGTPLLWESVPLVSFTKEISAQFPNPGVYVIMFAVDPTLDGILATTYVDQVVVIVK